MRADHVGPHVLIWQSAPGGILAQRTWSGPSDQNDIAIDYPFSAAVLALPWAPGMPAYKPAADDRS